MKTVWHPRQGPPAPGIYEDVHAGYGVEDGEVCARWVPRGGGIGKCPGVMRLAQDACYCATTHAPCSACLDARIECDECGYVVGWYTDDENQRAQAELDALVAKQRKEANGPILKR